MPLLTTLTGLEDKAQISMAEVGEPTQYGYAERLMRTLKEEEVDLSEYRDYHDVYQHIGQFIEDVYMHKRVHSALGYLTPAEFEQQWLALPVNERATLCCPVLWGQYKQQKEQTTMRKLIVLSFITVDGIMQAPYLDEFLDKVMDEQWREPFDLLLGRKTFEIFASYWPSHEEEGPGPGINNATKYVASNTLHSHDWKKSVFLKGDVAEEVRKLKQQDGRDIYVYGSGNLIQTLLKHDLIDEFWLKICPITLGTGKRLFAEGTIPAAFKVSKSQVSPTGVIVANLERAGEVQTGTVGE